MYKFDYFSFFILIILLYIYFYSFQLFILILILICFLKDFYIIYCSIYANTNIKSKNKIYSINGDIAGGI